jgi:hypothetical protein
VLADKGYIGAGIGVHTPVKRPAGGTVLHTDTRTYNQLLTALRAPIERARPAGATGRRYSGSPSVHGESAPSSPRPSCLPQFSAPAGGNLSIEAITETTLCLRSESSTSTAQEPAACRNCSSMILNCSAPATREISRRTNSTWMLRSNTLHRSRCNNLAAARSGM